MGWYRRNQRDLPWRHAANDPYKQWIAEIMLQQTQVVTVIPYFNRFVHCFPSVRHLAAAKRDQVLDLWTGLGYYRRAHLLHDAAKRVVELHDGRFPQTAEELMNLPGIGRYTAGAIASIAFDQRAPILDGNVKRVLSRLAAIRQPIDQPAVIKRLWGLAETLLPQKRCGDFNQALMELGATICTPKSPSCQTCPIRTFCKALQSGRAETIPAANKATTTTDLVIQSLACRKGDSVLFRRRVNKGLWAGMWEFPSAESKTAGNRFARAVLPEKLHDRIGTIKKIGAVTHQLTHRNVKIVVHQTAIRSTRRVDQYEWHSLDDAPPLPRAFAKALLLLRNGR